MPQEFAEVGRRQQIVSQSDLGFYGSKQFLAMRKGRFQHRCAFTGGDESKSLGVTRCLSAPLPCSSTLNLLYAYIDIWWHISMYLPVYLFVRPFVRVCVCASIDLSNLI